MQLPAPFITAARFALETLGFIVFMLTICSPFLLGAAATGAL